MYLCVRVCICVYLYITVQAFERNCHQMRNSKNQKQYSIYIIQFERSIIGA